MQLEIILENVRVSRGRAVLLDGVSWRLKPGEPWVLLGANGAGKSTLIRLARGDIWPDQLPGGDFAGSRRYIVDGRESASPIDARRLTGLAGADLRDLYRRRGWNVAAWLVVASGLTDSPLPAGPLGEPERAAALAALERLGLADLAYRPFLELSQGQAMAVLLARALVREPSRLFLDEAADGLDAPARRKLAGMLEGLADQGVGLVLATHNPRTLPKLGFACLTLEKGRVARLGPLERPVRRTMVRPSPPAPAPEGGEPLMVLRGVTLTLAGQDVLHGVDWSLLPGQNWVVLGRNGAGKSSLVKLLAGDLHPSSGSVSRFGLAEPVSLWDLRGRLGLVAWDGQAEYPDETTVRRIVLSGFFGSFGLYETPTPEMQRRAEAWIERLGLAALADRPLSGLSQGQARKAMIGRALVHDPAVLLLDEPLSGLDQAARIEVLSLLDDLAAQGRQIVLVTHNAWEVPACATHALVLEAGRVLAAGPFEDASRSYAP